MKPKPKPKSKSESKLKYTPEEIGVKMDALGLWTVVGNSTWAVKPQGFAVPYFCFAFAGDRKPAKIRFVMLEGWQTFADFLQFRIDPYYAFYSNPIEFPHFEMVATVDLPSQPAGVRIFRHDTGYMPYELTNVPKHAAARALVAKILWQAYGVMMRLESERSLLMKFSDSESLFARVEDLAGEWRDEPLKVIESRACLKNVELPKGLVAEVKDLPIVTDFRLESDFRLHTALMTDEPHPRCVYSLVGIDAASGRQVIDSRTSFRRRDGSLREIWESTPVQFLRELVRLGKVPGEVMVSNQRVFSLLRPICFHLPFKLTLYDRLDRIDALFV